MKRTFALASLLLVALGVAWGDDKDEPEQPVEKGKTYTAIDNGGHLGLITGMAFTNDGKRLFTVGRDRTLQEWDSASGTRVPASMRPPTPGFGYASSRGIGLLRATGKEKGDVAAVVVADWGMHDPIDPKRIVNRLFVLNRKTGQIQDLKVPEFEPRGMVEAISSSKADGGMVASVRGPVVLVHSKLDQLWLGNAKQRDEALSSRWRFDTGKSTARALAVSPNGKRLAAVTLGDETPLLFLWDLVNGKLVTSTRLPGWGHGVAWSPDNKQFAVSMSTHPNSPLKDPVLQLWSADGKPLRTFTGKDLTERIKPGESPITLSAYNVAFRPFSPELVTTLHWGDHSYGSEQVVAVNLETGKARELLYRAKVMSPHLGYEEGPLPIAITADGKLAAVATAPRGQRIAWIDLTGKEPVRYSGTGDAMGWSVGWKKDGSTIAWNNGKASGLTDVLDLKTLVAHGEKVTGDDLVRGVLARDGWSVSRTGEPGKYRLGISYKDKPVAETSPSFRPIESYTLSAGKGKPWLAWSDRTGLRVLYPETKKPTSYLHPGGARSVGLTSSPDGKYLLASSTRDLLRIYRVEGAGKDVHPLLTIYTRGPDWVAWTGEGYYAATPGGERMLGWRVNGSNDRLSTYYPASRFRKQMHRPDLIAKLLETGNVTAALKALGQKEAASIEDSLPPTVKILKVSGDPVKKLTVKVRATPRGKAQPITSLRLMLDGRPVPGQAALREIRDPEGQKAVEREFTFELPPGEHDVAVMARSAAATGMSEEVRLTRPGQRDARLVSLFIGIDKYKNKDLELAAAVNDAEALAAALKANSGRPLYARVDDPVKVLDARATKKGILDAIEKLRGGGDKALGSNDLAIISFAGHGVKEGKEFYLMPVEANDNAVPATCISGEELKKALSGWPCQVLLILDACHSTAGAKKLGQKYRPATDDAAREFTDDDVGIVVLAAAMGHEKALEKAGKVPRGLFSYRLEEALAGKGQGRHPDGNVYLHHAFAHVFDHVKLDSREAQHPFLSLPWTVEPFPLVYKGK